MKKYQMNGRKSRIYARLSPALGEQVDRLIYVKWILPAQNRVVAELARRHDRSAEGWNEYEMRMARTGELFMYMWTRLAPSVDLSPKIPSWLATAPAT